jgi:clorobiocin biosynthesis protein CloN3
MDFDLSADQRKRFDRILAEASAVLDAAEPGAQPAGTAGPFTRAQWRAAAQLGLTGLCLPRSHGGGGLGALDTALCIEAFGQGCPDTGLVFSVCAHLLACAVPVRDFATAELRDQLLPGLASGDLIAANAITEDDAGSDTTAMAMTARPDGDCYVLSGEKSFVSNGPAADIIVTYGVTTPKAGFLGISGFAVPRATQGLRVSEPLAKMGLTSCPAGRVSFEECKVPAGYRLGAEGQGAAIFRHSMGWERSCLFAAYLGLMQAQLARCTAHASQRRQFGHSIGSYQAVSHRIAIMRQRLEGARLLLYRACWLMDANLDHTAATAIAKVAVSEAAVANSIDAIAVFGGRGYLTETGIEQMLRDCVPSTIFSGTTEIQRELIAKEMGL